MFAYFKILRFMNGVIQKVRSSWRGEGDLKKRTKRTGGGGGQLTNSLKRTYVKGGGYFLNDPNFAAWSVAQCCIWLNIF